MLGLFRRKPHERAGYTLYTEAVRAARDPYFYTELGVPDTLDGRFDLVGLHVFLLIDRLRAAAPPGPALAQAVFDAMFSDMDFNLREMGVGDMSVAKRNKEMWEAFHGRSKAYEAAFAAEDDAALLEAVGRNVWRGQVPEGADRVLTARLTGLRRLVAETPVEEFTDGRFRFPAEAPAVIPNGALAQAPATEVTV